MRKIILALALLCAGSAWAQVGQIATWPPKAVVIAGGSPISAVAHTAAGSGDTNSVTTAGINTTGATVIVVATSFYQPAAAVTVSDSKGNVWTPLGYTPLGVIDNIGQMYYCCASGTLITGSGHTFTGSTTGGYPSVAVVALNNTAAHPFDAQSAGAAATGTTVQPGSLTPAGNNEVFVTSMSFDATSTVSIGSGFTITDTANATGGAYEGISLAYKVQTTGGAENPTWSAPSTNHAAAGMAAFTQ